mgnify:CR=1 FL=1
MKLFVTLVFIAILGGCASGREFVRSNEPLVLATTTYDQVVKGYGKPRRTSTLTRDGIPLKIITYSYAVAVPYTTKLATKAMVFVFNNDVLVSHDYVSSFEDEKDAVHIDDDKVKQIVKGDKKSKVIATLGTPTGEAIYPLVTPKGSSLMRYSYMASYRVPFNPTPKITRKIVKITLDSNEVVSEITSEESKPN